MRNALDANYRLPSSFYWDTLRRCSVLKSLWYSARLHRVVLIGRRCIVRVHRTARIKIGTGSILMIGMAHDTPSGAALRLHPRSVLEVDGRVQLMRGCSVTLGYDARLSVGAGTFVNDGAMVVCNTRMTIGPDCAIAWGARVLDTDVHSLSGEEGALPSQPVTIGRHCWIGTNAIITKGSQIGDGSVVAAGAVVTSDVPPRSLAAGVPARVIRHEVTWSF